MGLLRSNANTLTGVRKKTTDIHNRGNKTRTKYIKSVKAPDATQCLKPGQNNKKIGGPVVTKGHWRGYPVFTLTLEERATCPPHCEQWDDCYGNNMPFGHRVDHTHPLFYKTMENELDSLDYTYPYGYVIRPHILGDFFDESYVRWWGMQVRNRTALHGWGFTHHRRTSELGLLIDELINCERVNVRFSDDPEIPNSTKVEDNWEYQPTNNEIVCPEQLGKTKSCADCSLCWEARNKRIVFLRH